MDIFLSLISNEGESDNCYLIVLGRLLLRELHSNFSIRKQRIMVDRGEQSGGGEKQKVLSPAEPSHTYKRYQTPIVLQGNL